MKSDRIANIKSDSDWLARKMKTGECSFLFLTTPAMKMELPRIAVRRITKYTTKMVYVTDDVTGPVAEAAIYK